MNVKTNFGDFLRRRAFITPQLEATVEPALNNRRFNFRELNARCNRVAHALQADHLALWVERNRVDAGYFLEECREGTVLVDLGDGVALLVGEEHGAAG